MRYNTIVTTLAVIFAHTVTFSAASSGDSDRTFQLCMVQCRGSRCEDSLSPPAKWCKDQGFFNDLLNDKQHTWYSLFGWDCTSNCQYRCMWWTEDAKRSKFQSYKTVQYYGKWPFARFLGIQEPAAVLFSGGNLLVHGIGLRRFKSLVRECKHTVHRQRLLQLNTAWSIFGYLFITAWSMAILFHTRDVFWTERADYFSASAGIMYTALASIIRLAIEPKNLSATAAFTMAFSMLWLHHVYSMTIFFDYGYNAVYNAIFVLSLIPMWVGWWLRERKRRRYAWKPAVFSVVVPLFAATELGDFAPFWSIFDAHSIWHALTIPCAALWWSFLIDDLRFETAKSYIS